MDPFWIFPVVCLGMMLLCMFSHKEGEFKGCFGMMHTSREQELIKEIEALKEEINRLKKQKF